MTFAYNEMKSEHIIMASAKDIARSDQDMIMTAQDITMFDQDIMMTQPNNMRHTHRETRKWHYTMMFAYYIMA